MIILCMNLLCIQVSYKALENNMVRRYISQLIIIIIIFKEIFYRSVINMRSWPAGKLEIYRCSLILNCAYLSPLVLYSS